MLNQDHLLMIRLMKLIIKYDRAKDKEAFEEVLEPRKLPAKSLMKIVVLGSHEQSAAEGGSLEEPTNV